MTESKKNGYSNLDVLIVSFEGVLGAFKTPIPELDQESTDTLILRPGLAQALNDLLPYFKIVILTNDRSSLHQKAILSALDKNEVPYDAVYRTIGVVNDNLFTYHSILRDLDSTKLQVLFITSTMISINDLSQ